MWMYLCTDDFFTLNSAVPMERQVLDFLFACRCTSWRKGHLCMFLARATNYLPLLIYACHLLASSNPEQTRYFVQWNSILPLEKQCFASSQDYCSKWQKGNPTVDRLPKCKKTAKNICQDPPGYSYIWVRDGGKNLTGIQIHMEEKFSRELIS